MLFSVEQAFVGREEIRAPLKRPAWEATANIASKRLKDKRLGLESPRELARQTEAKRKQAPQSEANVCRHKCNLKNTLPY